jgi:hypothetical protein
MARKEIRFHIDGTSPHTIPMARLAEYLTELSALMGNQKKVHFLRVEEGSLPCVMEIEPTIEPKILYRVKRAAAHKGPQEAIKAQKNLREMLKHDSLSAALKTDNGEIVVNYPLVREKKEETFGPFWQEGSLEGRVVRLGGIDETLPVHLVYEGTQYICNASRDIIRQLGPKIWGDPIRVYGRGKWCRDVSGKWVMQFFDISSFEDLSDSTLSDAISKLRAIPDNSLKSIEDPLAMVKKIRSGD